MDSIHPHTKESLLNTAVQMIEINTNTLTTLNLSNSGFSTFDANELLEVLSKSTLTGLKHLKLCKNPSWWFDENNA